jgi:hypothetical protein
MGKQWVVSVVSARVVDRRSAAVTGAGPATTEEAAQTAALEWQAPEVHARLLLLDNKAGLEEEEAGA